MDASKGHTRDNSRDLVGDWASSVMPGDMALVYFQ
jgi:hypothetical protein